MLHVRRCLAAALAPALLVTLMLVGAGSVGAASTPPPCYVTALNSGGQTAYCPPAPASAAAAAGYAYLTPYVYTSVPYYYPGTYAYTGVPVAYTYPAVPYYYGGYGSGAVYGYTAAGPIVGFDANGLVLVYDVRGGTIDAYTVGPNGKYCEANNQGKCI